jgi:hypothetical protein
MDLGKELGDVCVSCIDFLHNTRDRKEVDAFEVHSSVLLIAICAVNSNTGHEPSDICRTLATDELRRHRRKQKTIIWLSFVGFLAVVAGAASVGGLIVAGMIPMMYGAAVSAVCAKAGTFAFKKFRVFSSQYVECDCDIFFYLLKRRRG